MLIQLLIKNNFSRFVCQSVRVSLDVEGFPGQTPIPILWQIPTAAIRAQDTNLNHQLGNTGQS